MTPASNQTPSSSRGRVIVLGYIVRGPLGGLAWHHLQYVVGLARLGYDVWFFEHGDAWASCYDPDSDAMTSNPSYGMSFAADAFDRLGLQDRWAYHDRTSGEWLGPAGAHANRVFESADVLINVSGVNDLHDWGLEVSSRIYIDTDPAFTQIRNNEDPEARARTANHNVFLTFAENIGTPGCTIPADGFPWQPTRQPVVTDLWDLPPGNPARPFTTVMQWDSYDAVEFDGVRYGMKSDSFEPFVDLPARVDPPLELALGSESAPRDRLRERGWRLVDPLAVTRDTSTYQDYITSSAAEFGVAKHGYVISRSGWFSERSVNYLAGGRPVVVQDTGFTDWIDTEDGVIAFSSPEEAVEGIGAVSADYRRHARTAADVARAYFSSEAVLTDLVEHARLNTADS